MSIGGDACRRPPTATAASCPQKVRRYLSFPTRNQPCACAVHHTATMLPRCSRASSCHASTLASLTQSRPALTAECC
jgi:hypothetical protein